MAAVFSWTRLAICRHWFKAKFCDCCKINPFSALVAMKRFEPMCALCGDQPQLGANGARWRVPKDMFYRLNGFTIQLPPLRERKDDIPLLLEYFLRRARKEMNKNNLDGLSPSALSMLTNYHWPGNVRQLQSVVRQAVLNTTGTVTWRLSLCPALCRSRDMRMPLCKLQAWDPLQVRHPVQHPVQSQVCRRHRRFNIAQ